jgi:sialidase-1
MKKTFALILTIMMSTLALASNDNKQRIFDTPSDDAIPYRIPAIATCNNGDLIAVSDYRYCKSDIGYGYIDLVYRISRDNGHTWGKEAVLADGNGIEQGNVWNYAFGDCALVADKTSKEVVAICAAGKSIYYKSTRDNPCRVAIFRSHNNGKTWDQGKEITEQIYGLFDHSTDGPINGMFMGSGKIHQSRYVKIGKYYRLYAALCTRNGNFVIYSDDFGKNWQVLGDINKSCCRDGDEPKCEEEPDGSVILSSRTNGRFFNVFTFTDVKAGKGEWGDRVSAKEMSDIQNACNGEILIIKAKKTSDGTNTYLAIQSVPFGPKRTNVGFFYKEIGSGHLDAASFATDWHKGLQVSKGSSAYSTMTLQKDGKIGFLWEEGPTIFNLDYEALSVKEITEGHYIH